MHIGRWLSALAFAALVIAWPWLSGKFTIPWDAKAQFLPELQFLAQSLARGESPFWTPYVFSGHPQIADAQSLIFSPPFLMLALLDPFPTAWAADVTLYLCLTTSAAAFWLWLTDKGLDPLPAFVAALGFAFGASMAWRVQHTGQVLTLAYLPFVLLFLDRALARTSLPYAIAAGVTAAFLVLGRDQVGLLSVYFLIAYVLSAWWREDDRAAYFKRAVTPLAAAGAAGALVIFLPILMTLLLAQDSNRPAIDLDGAHRGSLHPVLLLTAIAPDVFGSSGVQSSYWGPPSVPWGETGLFFAQNMGQLYVGAAIAIAVLWGIAGRVYARGEGLFFAVALTAALLYALGWYTPVFAWFHALLPGVGLYRRPADATFLIGFLLCVLGAFSLDSLLKRPQAGSWRAAVVAGGITVLALAAMIGLAARAGRLGEALWYIAVPTLLFASAAGLLLAITRNTGATRHALGMALAAFTVADLAYSNGPGGATALPHAEYDVLDPATRNDTILELKTRTLAGVSPTRRDRIELAGLGFHWPNASLTHGLENTLGYNPVRLSWVTSAVGAGDSSGLPEDRKFPPLFPSYRSPLANLLGLRWIATGVPVEQIDPTLKAAPLPLAARTKDAFIYENKDALPRVMFAPDATAADFADMLKTGLWPRTDFEQTVLLAPHDIPAGHPPAPRAPGRAAITRYTNTLVEIEAESPQGGYLVLNDIWHPWWFATVDGNATAILRANVIFRAVPLPPGKHTVVFRFQPVAGALAELVKGR